MADVSFALIRLASTFGEPWNQNDLNKKVLAAEWMQLLVGQPKKALQLAVTRWIERETRWPKISDILKAMANIYAPQQKAGKLHESRTRGWDYPFASSKLRRDKAWAAFLDSQHLTLEHNYFADAEFGDSPHVIFVATEARAEYIRVKFGEHLNALFDRKVIVKTKGAKNGAKTG